MIAVDAFDIHQYAIHTRDSGCFFLFGLMEVTWLKARLKQGRFRPYLGVRGAVQLLRHKKEKKSALCT